MRIRTRLILASWGALVVALVNVGAFAYGLRISAIVELTGKHAQEIETFGIRLLLLTQQTILLTGTHADLQWRSAHRDLSAAVERALGDPQSSSPLLAQMQEQTQDLSPLHDQALAVLADPADPQQQERRTFFIERLTNNLQELADLRHRWAREIEKQLSQQHNLIHAFSVSSLLLLILAIGYLVLLMRQRVLQPLLQLRQGTEALESGIPSPSSGIRSDDELGEAIEAVQRTTQKLWLSDERSRTVVEAAPSAMLIVDADGVITLANRMAETIFSYPREELLGQPIERLLPERSRAAHPGLRRSFNKDPRARPMGAGRELYALRKDGSEFPVEVSLSSIRTSEGLRVLASIVDITERKRADQAVKALLAEKEMLLAEIHHRVKNNLQVISSLFVLRAKRITDEVARKVLAECEARVHAMALLHEQIYREGTFGKVEMKAYLQELAATLISMQLSAARDLRCAVRGAPLTMDTDTAVALAQITAELLSNVFKHAYPTDASGLIEIDLEVENGDRRLTVSDDGRGLPADFDLASGRDTLGLTIVSMLCKRIGGRFSAGRRAQGARFTVTWAEKKPQ